jgi:hemolysin activation/secretion protein
MEEARLGASAWVAFGDIAFGRSEPGGALAPLELEGDSTVARLGARYGWIKQRNKAVDLGVRIESVDQQNDLGFLRSVGLGTIPLFDERLSVLALEANGRWRSLGALATVFGVEVRQGLQAFGASKSGDALLSRADGRTVFTSFRGNATARWTAASVDARPYLQAAASGQWTDDPLPAYEEFQVGNYTVGRGFDPGAASGDRAIAVQLEAGIDFSAGAGMASIYGFADHARLWNLDADSYDSSPRSSGLGLRLQGRAGRLDLAWALPQNGAFPGAPKSEDRLLVTYTNTFSIR